MVYDFIYAEVKYIYQSTQFVAVEAYKNPLEEERPVEKPVQPNT